MNSSCTICFDLFDGQNMVATRCGHVYHYSCIVQWLDAKTGFCPECRGPMTSNSLTKLYMHTADSETVVLNSSFKNELESKKTALLAKESEIKTVKLKVKQIREHANEMEKQKNKFHDECVGLHKDIASLRIKLRSADGLKSKITSLENENARMKSQVEHFSNVQTLMQGTKKETEEILKQFGCSSAKGVSGDVVGNLGSMCSTLKQELIRVKKQREQLKHDVQKLSYNLGLKNAEYKKLQLSYAELENRSKYAEASPRPITIASSNAISSASQIVATPVYVEKGASDRNGKSSEITPITFEAKTPIMRRVIGPSTKPSSRLQKVCVPARKPVHDDDDSITKVGYNGLGCFEQVITPRIRQLATPKPYKKNPNVKRLKKN